MAAPTIINPSDLSTRMSDSGTLDSICSNVFTANAAATTAQNDPDNPVSIEAGDHANDANVSIIPVDGDHDLELFLFTNVATPGVYPIVRCFGWVRRHDDPTLGEWIPLLTNAASLTGTWASGALGYSDGTNNKYSGVVYPLRGVEKVMVTVSTAMTTATGSIRGRLVRKGVSTN